MSAVGKTRSVFVRYTLPVSTPWASGGMDFSTASQNISAPIWKRKWFMWHHLKVLRKTDDVAGHILNWCNVSRLCLKNMQKLWQRILEDHLRAATIQLFWQTNKTNQPQNHSPLTLMISTLGQLNICEYFLTFPSLSFHDMATTQNLFCWQKSNIQIRISCCFSQIFGGEQCNWFGRFFYKL